MAGAKINDYSIGDSNIQSVMLTLDKAFKGQHQVSLTNYDNTSESQIAAGSVVECNGAQFKFDSNESITGSPSDGTVYIRLVPAGDTITAEYTSTAPTWSDSKQGWYGTGGDVNKRYLEFILFKNSGSWNKQERVTPVNNSFLPKSLTKIHVGNTLPISGTAGSIPVLILGTVDYDTNNEYNASTGIFTIKNKGSFIFSGTFRGTASSSLEDNVIFFINKNSSTYVSVSGHPVRLDGVSSSGKFGLEFCFPVELNAGDTLSIQVIFNASPTNYSLINEVFLYQII